MNAINGVNGKVILKDKTLSQFDHWFSYSQKWRSPLNKYEIHRDFRADYTKRINEGSTEVIYVVPADD